MTFNDILMYLPDGEGTTGTLTIEGDRIAAVERHPVAEPKRLVMPGLVNAHGHSAMTLVRGTGGGLPLQRWLEEAIFPIEAKMKPGDIYAGAKWGAMEMLAGGTTAVADMYDFPSEGERAFAEAGIRARTNRVGLHFVPGRLAECIAYAEAKPERDLCIHSEYLTNEEFCRGLAAANEKLARPVHFHCSETEKEHRECLERHGKTPTAYLASTGLLDHGGYAAHCVWCTDDDFRIMAEKKVTLVHNPTSNLKLGSGIARIVRAKELGVNVALGTDGCASNDNLDMFEEMHLAALLPKGTGRDPTALPAREVIAMATENGARALGFDSGRIEPGKLADLCVVDLDRLHLTPYAELANLIVYSMHGSDVVETWVGGEKVYDRGEFMKLDRAKAKAEFLASVKGLKA